MTIKNTIESYQLYTDGSHLAYRKIAGIGGYILKPNGIEIFNFSDIISDPRLNDKHEILALETGLKKCLEYGIKNIQCFSDEQQICHISNIKDIAVRDRYLSNNPLLKNIFDLIPLFDDITFNYIARNENKVADKLSRKAMLEYIENPLSSTLIPGAYTSSKLLYNEMYVSKEKKDIFKFIKNDINYFFTFEFHQKETDSVILYKKISKNNNEFSILEEDKILIKPRNWMPSYLNYIVEKLLLDESDYKKIGICFVGFQSKKLEENLRGYNAISPKLEKSIIQFDGAIDKFEQVILNNDSKLINYLYPIETAKKINLNKKNEVLYAIKTLGNENYQLGTNLLIEQRFSDQTKLDSLNIIELQKKYFAAFLKISMQERNTNMYKQSDNDIEIMIEKTKNDLTSQGVILKFK